MSKIMKNKKFVVVFVCAFVAALSMAIFPSLANTPVEKPNMLLVRDGVEGFDIYTEPNVYSEKTGYFINSGEMYEWLGIGGGFCNIAFYDKDGKRQTGYCVTTAFKRIPVRLGIDVSHYQGDVDWLKVANDKVNGQYSVEYAMIKVGQTSTSKSKVAFMDSKFKEYIEGATANNIKAGVYFYSKATTVEQAVSEANWVLDNIKDYSVTMPVAFDYEDKSILSLSSEVRTDICKAFADTIKQAGHDCVIYSYQNFLRDNLMMADIEKKYDIWTARYSESLPIFNSTKMWQFTDSGSVDGIKGNVDMNWAFY